MRQDIATGNFSPDRIYLSGAVTPQAKALWTPPAGMGTFTSPNTSPAPVPGKPQLESRIQQSAAQNPWPAIHLQADLVLRIRLIINVAADEGVEIPSTGDVCHFCLSYHFKGVCNSKCSGHHSHRTMLQGNMGWMAEWRNRFSAEGATPPPVNVVETDLYVGGTSIASSMSSQIRLSWGGRGRMEDP